MDEDPSMSSMPVKEYWKEPADLEVEERTQSIPICITHSQFLSAYYSGSVSQLDNWPDFA